MLWFRKTYWCGGALGAGRTDRSKSSQHGILLQSLCQISRSQWVSSALHLLICSTCFLLKGSSFAIQAVIQHCYATLLFSTVTLWECAPLNLPAPYTWTSAHLNAALDYATITLTSTSHRMLTGMACISRRLSYCLCCLREGMCHAGSWILGSGCNSLLCRWQWSGRS